MQGTRDADPAAPNSADRSRWIVEKLIRQAAYAEPLRRQALLTEHEGDDLTRPFVNIGGRDGLELWV